MKQREIVAGGVAWGIFLSLGGLPFPEARADPRAGSYSRAELRAVLNGVFENHELTPSSSAVLTPAVMKLVRSYRGVGRNLPPVALKDAPFTRLVILERGARIYGDEHRGIRKAELDKVMSERNWPVESLFDGLLEGILSGDLPEGIAGDARQLGPCLARKALSARGPSCRLDPRRETARELKPTRILWLKLDCGGSSDSVRPCAVRREIFDGVKPRLHDARRDPEVRAIIEGEFDKRFPAEYRKGFIGKLGTIIQDFPVIVTGKLGGGTKADPLWDAGTPLVEPDLDSAPNRVTLRGFAAGLRADIRAAAWLAQVPLPAARAMAAPLFYAAANRLLLLSGGKEAAWKGAGFEVSFGGPAVCEATTPRGEARLCAPPLQFRARPFGGWGLTLTTTVDGERPMFTSWDWAAYDPTASAHPTPVRLLPEIFSIGSRGLARLESQPEETTHDLAEMIDAVAEFLRLTRPGTALARHFGPESRMSEVLDPTRPMLFPREGRKLAVGMLAGVLKNLIVEGKGHLEVAEGGEGAALGLVFHDRVTFDGRLESTPTVEAVARLLRSAGRLRAVLEGDPDVPAALLEFGPRLDSALQVGSLILGAQGQDPDGGFRERLGDPAATQGRRLSDTVAALRALTQAHDRSRLLVIRVRIAQGWKFLESLWGERPLPFESESREEKALPPSLAWELLNLWDQTQVTVRGDLAEEDWARWEGRFERLREGLWKAL